LVEGSEDLVAAQGVGHGGGTSVADLVAVEVELGDSDVDADGLRDRRGALGRDVARVE